jgi:predicted peptidase
VKLLLAAMALVAGLEARQETGFLNRAVVVKGITYKYQVYLPQDYTKSRKWPVILFLHGGGERGDDGLAQTQVGIARNVRLQPERWPAILVMPQCRKDVFWTTPEMQDQAMAALEAAIKEFKGERSQVYLTGLSLGGYGTFSLGARHPERFAALAPICGGVVMASRPELTPAGSGDPYENIGKLIGKTPIWIFHGGDDKTVAVTESQKMREVIKAAGGTPKYTEYPGVAHNSWDKAYAEADFVKWMLAQKLAAKPKQKR